MKEVVWHGTVNGAEDGARCLEFYSLCIFTLLYQLASQYSVGFDDYSISLVGFKILKHIWFVSK